MQKIRVKEVHPATEDKKPTVIVDDNGARMSGFDTKLRNLKSGDLIEAELEVKGKYVNIKEWKLLEGAGEPATTTSQQSPDNIRLQIDADARITSLTLACQLLIAGKIESDDIDATANKYYDWLMSPGKALPIVKPLTSAPAPVKQTDDDLESTLFGKDRAPSTPAGKTPDDIVAEDVPDLNAVFRVCFSFWPDMLSQKICSELGYESPAAALAVYKGKSGWEPWLTIKRLKQPEGAPKE